MVNIEEVYREYVLIGCSEDDAYQSTVEYYRQIMKPSKRQQIRKFIRNIFR